MSYITNAAGPAPGCRAEGPGTGHTSSPFQMAILSIMCRRLSKNASRWCHSCDPAIWIERPIPATPKASIAHRPRRSGPSGHYRGATGQLKWCSAAWADFARLARLPAPEGPTRRLQKGGGALRLYA